MCQTKFDMEETSPEARHWSVDTYMLANVIDAIQASDWHFIAANSKHAPKPPKPFPRPDSQKKKVNKTNKTNMWPGKTIVDKG